jgi:hypothetical protein
VLQRRSIGVDPTKSNQPPFEANFSYRFHRSCCGYDASTRLKPAYHKLESLKARVDTDANMTVRLGLSFNTVNGIQLE